MSTFLYNSRRTAAIGLSAAVASDDPAASRIGIDILQNGGNAADAAVAMSAVISVLLPWAAGPGGDCFCLFYKKSENKVYGINGSGRSPKALTPELVEKLGFNENNPIPQIHGLAANVPGVPAAWIDILEKFGNKKIGVAEILQPAINLAENGFAVSKISSSKWINLESTVLNAEEFLINKCAPKYGQIMQIPTLASTLRKIAEDGKRGFYEGEIAQQIVTVNQQMGGVMTLQDLKDHYSTFEDPLSINYHGKTIWEMPPNSQGITVLMALNILSGYDIPSFTHNSPDYLHLLIETMKMAQADTYKYICDPSVHSVPIKEMLAPEYGKKKRQNINPNKCNLFPPSKFSSNSDTSYLTVVDQDGNACSLIFSIYLTFGSCLIPKGCGFSLNNRAQNFSLIPNHPNEIGPQKRSYNTIIPAMITDTSTGHFLCCFGAAGGFGQPGLHVQVLMNSLHFHMDPQESLDAPRFVIISNDLLKTTPIIWLEEGISEETVNELQTKGHVVKSNYFGLARSTGFCRGHMITYGKLWEYNSDKNVFWAGSDPRADGIPIAI